MTLLTQYTASIDPNFQYRCGIALATAAVDIASEAVGGQGQPTTAQHEKRVAWAQGVLYDPVAAGKRYAAGIMTNATLAAKSAAPNTITDSELQFTVNSLVNAFAGA